MTAEARRLLEEAMKLPENERAALVSVLVDSLGDGASEQEIEAAWLAEAKRRLDDIRSGKTEPVAWEDVRDRLRARVERAKEQDAAAG